MLYINPKACIDCEACVAECPTDAIFHEDDVPEEFSTDIALNARMSLMLPKITEKNP